MRRKSIKENSGDFSDNRRQAEQNPDDDGTEGMARGMRAYMIGDRKSNDEYKCGKEQCGKLYHSYTAFYNHCKKSHQGIFPINSLYNGKKFQGPSKNRGRPRIKKTDVKDSIQIQSLKTQNELIQFLGTLPKKKKNQQLIVYVSNPIEQLLNALEEMAKFIKESNRHVFTTFLPQLVTLNALVSEHDLPDFYDPIEIHLYSQKMDSYSFLSIYNFLMDQQKGFLLLLPCTGISLMRRILIIWLARILEVPLLAEVIFTVGQIDKSIQKMEQKQYLMGKTTKFKQLIEKYFECIINEQSSLKFESKQEIQS